MEPKFATKVKCLAADLGARGEAKVVITENFPLRAPCFLKTNCSDLSPVPLMVKANRTFGRQLWRPRARTLALSKVA